MPDFPATDETGESTGLIEITPAMRFYLTDPVTDQTVRFDAEVTSSAELDFTWDPAP